MRRRTFFERNVIIVLQEEIRHHRWISLGLLVARLLQHLIGGLRPAHKDNVPRSWWRIENRTILISLFHLNFSSPSTETIAMEPPPVVEPHRSACALPAHAKASKTVRVAQIKSLHGWQNEAIQRKATHCITLTVTELPSFVVTVKPTLAKSVNSCAIAKIHPVSYAAWN